MGGYSALKNKETLLFAHWLNLKDKGEWNQYHVISLTCVIQSWTQE